MQWENKVWRKTGFCFILLPIALKAMLHFLKKRWPLQDSMENESFQLRPLTLVRGWARRTNRWTWERAAWEVGGESIECDITEAREMSVLQRRSGQCCQMLLGQRTSPQAQNRLHPAGSQIQSSDKRTRMRTLASTSASCPSSDLTTKTRNVFC